jgi:hypothetical protein
MFRARKLALTLAAISGAVVLPATFVASASAGWFVGGQELAAGSTAAIASLPTYRPAIGSPSNRRPEKPLPKLPTPKERAACSKAKSRSRVNWC